MQKNLVPIEQLVVWDDNPREMDEDAKERLKNDLRKFGQFSPLLAVSENSFMVVIGGNMRLQSMRELIEEGYEQFAKVWVEVVEFKKEGERWFAFLDGLKVGYDKEIEDFNSYATREQAKVEYALVHNNRTGSYVEAKLAKLVQNNPEIPLDAHFIDTGYPVDLGMIMQMHDMRDVNQGVSIPGDAQPRDTNRNKEQMERYQNATIKQIVLYFDKEQYEKTLIELEKVMTEAGVESNTEAVLYLLKLWKEGQE